jgi:hypothetical protein
VFFDDFVVLELSHFRIKLNGLGVTTLSCTHDKMRVRKATIMKINNSE